MNRAFVQVTEVVEDGGPFVGSPRRAGVGVLVDVPGWFKHLVLDDLVTGCQAARAAQRIGHLVRALGGERLDGVQIIGEGGEDLGLLEGPIKRRRGLWLAC